MSSSSFSFQTCCRQNQWQTHMEAVQHCVLVFAEQVPIAAPHSVGHQAKVCTQAFPRPTWPQPPTLVKQIAGIHQRDELRLQPGM